MALVAVARDNARVAVVALEAALGAVQGKAREVVLVAAEGGGNVAPARAWDKVLVALVVALGKGKVVRAALVDPVCGKAKDSGKDREAPAAALACGLAKGRARVRVTGRAEITEHGQPDRNKVTRATVVAVAPEVRAQERVALVTARS